MRVLVAVVPALLLPASAAVSAQSTDSLRTVIERSVVQGAWADLDSAIERLRERALKSPDNYVVQYDLGYALHRRVGSITEGGVNGNPRPLLEEADRALQRSYSMGGGGSALALRGTVTGQLAEVSGTFSAMRLGPRAFRQLDQALKIAPEDPRVALLNGMVRLRAPRPFGGGAEKAEREFRRALALFERDSAKSPAPVWGRADAHIWLGIALAKLERREEARREFEKALALAPGHVWVAKLTETRTERSQ